MLPSLARTSEEDELDDFDSAFNDGVHAQDNDLNTRKMSVFIFCFTSRIRTPAVGPSRNVMRTPVSSFGFIIRMLTSVTSLQARTVPAVRSAFRTVKVDSLDRKA